MNPTPTPKSPAPVDIVRLRELLRSQIQRYELTEHCRGMDCWHQMEENEEGDYVLYSEIAAILNDAPALLDEIGLLRLAENYNRVAISQISAERDKLREEVERLQKDRDGWVEAAAQRLREKIAAEKKAEKYAQDWHSAKHEFGVEMNKIRSERDSLRQQNERLLKEVEELRARPTGIWKESQ